MLSIVSAALGAEEGRSLQPGSLRLAWAKQQDSTSKKERVEKGKIEETEGHIRRAASMRRTPGMLKSGSKVRMVSGSDTIR